MTCTTQVANNDEEIPIYVDAEDPGTEIKRQFAQEQYLFLKKEYGEPNRVSRIFKAAGPGQVQEAFQLATSEDWGTPEGKIRLDLLDCLLTGAGGIRNFPWRRMQEVLDYNGFYVPKAKSYYSFLRIMDGALEILFPGCFPFTDDEIKDIEKRSRV